MTFEVKIDGNGAAYFASVGKLLRGSLKAANRATAGIIRQGIQNTALYTFRTNSRVGLAESFRVVDVSKDGATVLSDKVYAGIQDRGGVIRAKNVPYLVYQLADGSWRKSKQVTIPATRFVSRGVESVRDQIEKFQETYLEIVLKQAEIVAAAVKSGGQIHVLSNAEGRARRFSFSSHGLSQSSDIESRVAQEMRRLGVREPVAVEVGSL